MEGKCHVDETHLDDHEPLRSLEVRAEVPASTKGCGELTIPVSLVYALAPCIAWSMHGGHVDCAVDGTRTPYPPPVQGSQKRAVAAST